MNILPFSTRRCMQTAILCGSILLTAAAGFCGNNAEPINIEADRMISQEEKNSVVFLGNVEASQGKVTIRTDEMTVYYEQNDPNATAGKSSEVKKMICVGNVEVTQDDWLGTGKRMDYFAKDQKVILSGDAKAWQGQNMVAGKTIIYYLDEKRSVVEQEQAKPGEKAGRVKAVIHQGSNK